MKSLFLSYARADDEPFVRQLYERLTAAGLDVWFDREAMPSRALSFLQEIRDAVRRSDRTLVVIGPRAVSSDYVRAEWQAALVEGKVVVPVLRLGDYELIPPELRNLHCPDVRSHRAVDAWWPEVHRVLRDPIPPLGTLLGGVPELPPHFQPRPDDLCALAEHLCYDVQHPAVVDGPQRVTVLAGMGGVGKSVLAAGFARSTSARRVFGDGVAWVDVGAAAPVDVLRSLLRLLGAPWPASATLADGVSTLRARMHERRLLVVLDNAWTIDSIEPVAQALSSVSRLLVTTRDASLAAGLGARQCSLSVLSEVAARRHLADWTGVAPDALPAAADDVARECGYLPFALALQGALVHAGMPWSDLLASLQDADIDFASQRFAGYPHPTILSSLRVSVDALRAMDPDAARAFEELAAFQWDEGVPAAAVIRLWTRDAAMAERDARRLLTRLADKSLLRLDGGLPQASVRLHDLFRDYLVATTDVSAANVALVDAYRQACDGDWPHGPDDGYFVPHLIHHIATLDDDGAELDRLLAMSTIDGRHAWSERCAQDARSMEFRGQLLRMLSGRPAPRRSRAARMMLLLASATAQATRVPATLGAALVAFRHWTPERAIDGARQLPLASSTRGEPGRIESLLAVLAHLEEPASGHLLDELLGLARDASEEALPDETRIAFIAALASAGRVGDALSLVPPMDAGQAVVRSLAVIIPVARPEQRPAFVSRAIEACAHTGALFRSAALEPLCRVLDVTDVGRALAEAATPITGSVARGWCQVVIVERLVALGEVARALELAQAIEDRQSRAEALAAVAPSLSGAEREIAVLFVLDTAEALDDVAWRQHVAQETKDIPPALETMLPLILCSLSWRASTLTALLPHLDGAEALRAQTVLDKILQAACEAPEDTTLLKDLSHLPRAMIAPHLEALLVMASGLDQHSRTSLLEALVPVVDAAQARRILDLARELPDHEARFGLVEALVPALDRDGVVAAQRVIGEVGDLDARVLAAASCMDPSHRASRARVLRFVQRATNEYVRARAIAMMLPHMADDELVTVRQLVDSIDDPETLATVALPALARRVPEPERSMCLTRASALAAGLTDAERRVWALEEFVGLLDEGGVARALSAFAESEALIDEEWRAFGRALALATALPHMNPATVGESRAEVLALVLELAEVDLRRDVLARLASAGESGWDDLIVDLIEHEEDPFERAMMAGFVIDRAPEHVRGRLVHAAFDELDQITGSGFEDANDRAEGAVARVLPFVERVEGAFELATNMESATWRTVALRAFTEHLPAGMYTAARDAVQTIAGAGDRALACLQLARHAPNTREQMDLLARALDAALEDESGLLHDRILPDLATALCTRPAAEVAALFDARWVRLAEIPRAQCLAKLHGLGPALAHADPGAASAIVDAILDVGEWWP